MRPRHRPMTMLKHALSALWVCGAAIHCGSDRSPSTAASSAHTAMAPVGGAAPLQPRAAVTAGSAAPTSPSALGASTPASTPAADAADAPTAKQDATSFGPLVPEPGETCYELKTHGATSSVDDSAYPIPVGEHYAQFYFKAPWPDGSVATRFATKYDDATVLHHWLLFQTDENRAEGYHEVAPLSTLVGVNARLISGWPVGAGRIVMPSDVGQELPSKGTQLNLQWHFYNSTDKPRADRSIVQVCTVPADKRPHTASITWIGTENLTPNKAAGATGMPPHQKSTFSGTCDPLRAGMSPSEPIHIVAFWPHMHELGTSMQAIVNHADGTKQTIFDKPYYFNAQVHHMLSYDLAAGDTLTAVCNFDNTTNGSVPFGESPGAETCYMFTFAWPAHALENRAMSLIGATHTCW